MESHKINKNMGNSRYQPFPTIVEQNVQNPNTGSQCPDLHFLVDLAGIEPASKNPSHVLLLS